jgi:hypothetical protein
MNWSIVGFFSALFMTGIVLPIVISTDKLPVYAILSILFCMSIFVVFIVTRIIKHYCKEKSEKLP